MRDEGPNFARHSVVTTGALGWSVGQRQVDRGRSVAAPQPGYHIKEDS
jgi:hypothetical protein